MGSGTGTPVSGSIHYSSVIEVRALTRHLLGGQSTFNSTTRPTLTDVQTFLTRAGGLLNIALAGRGFSVPITNSTAKLACDDWVTAQAVEYVELTQRGTGYSDAEGSRTRVFAGLHRRASDFAKENELGFKRVGAEVGHRKSEGLGFSGQTLQADRADPDDTGLEQPKFTRGLFDHV